MSMEPVWLKAMIQRGAWYQPPKVEPDFWDHPPLREALRLRHMGRVIRAYRHHPAHGRHPIPQVVIGEWFGMAQAKVSQLEGGAAPQHLDWLTYAAQVLSIPAELLWFRMPSDDGPPRPRPRTYTVTVTFNVTLQPVTE
ncbi:hypothetical protein [Polymorphospora rubra]|uniref:hypothetical protein n=1 Tax=Polymorphospora rubra TaxID=338584 RepID=UPI003404EE2A